MGYDRSPICGGFVIPELLTLLALGLLQTGGPTAPVFIDRPCADAAMASVARCGVVYVPESRDRPDGRIIGLNVLVLPSMSGGPDLPPLFTLEGGPGLAAVPGASFFVTEGAAYRARRDLVFFDQRGTGGSSRLSCPDLESPTDENATMYPAELVNACRVNLEGRADLTRYGTRDAVQDLDDVRAALGHDRIDIFALSYGTTVALRYLSGHPDRVRAAILMGTAPPDAMPPRDHAPAAEHALSLLFEDCRRDAECHAAIPTPESDLRRAVQRLDSMAGDPPPEVFMERIRTLLYQPLTARRAPWIIHRAAEGDLAPFRAATRRDGPSPFAEGVYLSITCNESFALMDAPAAMAASRATRFGDFRLRIQSSACALWPSVGAAPDHLDRASGPAAVLFLSGRLDPVTPPDWAEAASRGFPNSRHLIMPYSGHLFDGLSGIDTCLDPLMIRFFETADADTLDAACLAEMRPPAFQTAEP